MLLNDELPCSRLLSKFSYPTPRRKWVNQLLTKLIISEWTDLRKRFASEFSEQNAICHIEDTCSRGWWDDPGGKVFAAQGAKYECPLVIKKKIQAWWQTFLTLSGPGEDTGGFWELLVTETYCAHHIRSWNFFYYPWKWEDNFVECGFSPPTFTWVGSGIEFRSPGPRGKCLFQLSHPARSVFFFFNINIWKSYCALAI